MAFGVGTALACNACWPISSHYTIINLLKMKWSLYFFTNNFISFKVAQPSFMTWNSWFKKKFMYGGNYPGNSQHQAFWWW